MQTPPQLIHPIVRELTTDGENVCLSVGFERYTWRLEALVEHIMEWLPEFAMNHSELEAIGHHNALRMLRRAAKSIYQTEKYGSRGEFGELILHIALRHIYGTIPAVSKIFYKSGVNKTVEGFDAVHVMPREDSLELWIGETKFYASLADGVRDVADEIVAHLATNYLRNEFLLISNKLDPSWPHYETLVSLLDENTSLDHIFANSAIPVLLTYDTESINECERTGKALSDMVESELKDASTRLRDRLSRQHKAAYKHDVPVAVHVMLFPIKDKAALARALHNRLMRLQA